MKRRIVELVVIGAIAFCVGVLVSPIGPGSDVGFIETTQQLGEAIGMILLAAALIVSARATRAAFMSNELTERSMRSQLRPWVSVELKAASNLIWREWEPYLTIELAVTNHGNSPAIRVTTDAKLFVATGDNALHQLRDLSTNTLNPMIAEAAGSDVFPGETRTLTFTCHASREDIERGLAFSKRQAKGETAAVGLLMLVAVEYRSTYDETERRTAYISALDKVAPAPKLVRFRVGEEVERDELFFHRGLMDGGTVS